MHKEVVVKFPDMILATFLSRPNRFIVRCVLAGSGTEVEAHLADPGRLKELLVPGATLYLRPSDNPKRKTKWSACLVLASDATTLVSLQSLLANRITAQALKQKALPELERWNVQKPEFSYGKSRWDFCLVNGDHQRMLLEVKSCTLVQNGVAMFPDAVTARGTRHVQELTTLQREGKFQAAILFIIQREDAQLFKTANHIDPAFAGALVKARDHGVKLLAYNSLVEKTSITLGKSLPIDLSGGSLNGNEHFYTD